MIAATWFFTKLCLNVQHRGFLHVAGALAYQKTKKKMTKKDSDFLFEKARQQDNNVYI